jgi:hypothetical protein
LFTMNLLTAVLSLNRLLVTLMPTFTSWHRSSRQFLVIA